MTTFGPHPRTTRQETQRLVELTSGRKALETLRQTLTDRLHRHSDDYDATHALRLVTAKLQHTSYGTPVILATS
jgi:hypothetical protein